MLVFPIMIWELKYLSTHQRILTFHVMSQEQHTSTLQLEDEGFIPEKFRPDKIGNANTQSSTGNIVIHLIKIISIEGKVKLPGS